MPERMCIVSREVKDERELIRFVRSPDGVATPDLKRKLPGRGVWVSLEKAKVAEAQKRNLFARGFGAQTEAPAELAEMVAGLLRQQALAMLSLARKAGEAVSGFVKIEEALKKGKVAILLHAASAASDGAAKLDAKAGPETVILRQFTVAEMDLAFGRENVIHAAVITGGLADSLKASMRRYAAYEGLDLQQV